jgi:cardiolipin synthase
VITLRAWFPLSVLACAAVAFVGCSGPRLEIRHPVAVTVSVTNVAFRHSLGALTGSPFLRGNKITRLKNGDVFPTMLRAIAEATNTITFENYLWDSGRVSDRFIEALTERAHAGVDVRVIADWLGSNIHSDDLAELRDAGVKFHFYNPLRLHRLSALNYRDHHKLLIVDGGVGFTGGVCIADEWAGNARRRVEWRDTHFLVEGPIVAQLQSAFAANWLKVEGEVLFGERFFPELERRGDALAQAFHSSPEGPRENTRIAFLSAIGAAQRSIRIEHSYFVPGDLAIEALVAARARGVKVEVIAPSVIDATTVRRAGRSLWPKLLRAGAEIYEFMPAMLHCKILIVDDVFVVAGSSNFDERSFHINDEANIAVLDPALAAQLAADFDQDKAQSRRITLEAHRALPWYERLYERMWGLFRPVF